MRTRDSAAGFIAGTVVAACTIAILTGCVSTNKSWARAANSGAPERARQMILTGERLDTTDTYRDTALLWAARNSYDDVVDYLLRERKADVNETHEITGETALMYAAKAGDSPMLALLLSHGAEVAGQDKTGRAAVDWAAQGGHTAIVETLTAQGTPTSATGESDNTLVAAVHSGNLDTVRLILERGADVNVTDAFGDSPLVAAAKVGDPAIARFLIGSGADVHAADRVGQTAFVLAVQVGALGIVEQLLDAGVRADGQRYADYPVIFFAAANGQAEMIDLLLAQGLQVDERASDEQRSTPLQVAAQTGHAAACALLIERGADVEAATAAGNTALLLAAGGGHAAAVELLLESGADPYHVNAVKHAPLYRATLNRRWFVVRQLMAAGIDLSAADIAHLAEDPSLAAPLFEIRGRLSMDKGDLEASVLALERSKEALLELAAVSRKRAVAQRRDEMALSVAITFMSTMQNYALTEARRSQARSNAQLAALVGAGSTEEYFARNQALQNVYERSITVDSMAREYDQYDWLSGWDSSGTSTQSELDADRLDRRAERVGEAIECLRADDATDAERVACAAEMLSN